MWTCVILLAVYSVVAGTTAGPKCEDVDSEACRLMKVQQPNLCQNNAVASSLCKRFCNLCPMECYHCDVTVHDYHLCNTTKLCNQGEVCMKKELTSFLDSHHEYQFTCTDRRICDGGNDLNIPFGKRRGLTRDISVTCCIDDLCNYPHSIQTTTTTTLATTTTTLQVCPKDIIFIVDQWSWHFQSELNSLIDLLHNVIGQIDIGLHDNLVSYVVVERHSKILIDLNDSRDKSSLLSHLEHAIIGHHPHTNPDLNSNDLQMTIRDVVHRVQSGRFGDRQNFEDAVVLIAFDSTMSIYDPTHAHYNETLQQISNDVITLMVGPTSSASMAKVNDIATDSQHILTVDDLRNYASIVDSLIRLIQKC